jgi:hypothetical protein
LVFSLWINDAFSIIAAGATRMAFCFMFSFYLPST